MMNVEQDEDEHSIEMHLSYIARVMEPRKGSFTVVPVLVGSLSHDKQVKNPKAMSQMTQAEGKFSPQNWYCVLM